LGAAARRHGFWGIFLLAAWPNALFDLCGICCGHFLMPFWQFFGATLMGKALVKVTFSLEMHMMICCLPGCLLACVQVAAWVESMVHSRPPVQASSSSTLLEVMSVPEHHAALLRNYKIWEATGCVHDACAGMCACCR
jgi:hypothetical protein